VDPPRIDNETEFIAEPRLLVGKAGEELVMIIKATFEWSPGAAEPELAPQKAQRAIRAADVPWGDPEKSSIKYPSDLCITKHGTDVIVVAAAHAPGGKPAPSFDAGVRVGSLEKAVRVFGPRVWQANGAGLTSPLPTKSVEVRYDHAWGGCDATDLAKVVEEPRNPVGIGVARDAATLTHQPAPSIEDPAQLIGSIRTKPAPAGLGAIGRHWEPRRQYLGTYDEAWLTERAPLLPQDHDDRANFAATPGLTASPPLAGGEDVALVNLTRGGGSVSFKLPKIRVRVRFDAKGREPAVVTPYVDTVILDTLHAKDPTDVVVELVWRAPFPAPRRMKDASFTISEAAS